MPAANLREPDSFVLEALDRIGPRPGARALDVACGRGRHALELARRGWSVEAWDRDAEALAELDEAAAAAGLRVTTRALDCEAPPDAGPFDLVVVVNYLDRELPRKLSGSVRAGTHLVVCTYTLDRAGEHPSARWCLDPGELARGFDGWSVLHERERDGRAGVLAVRT